MAEWQTTIQDATAIIRGSGKVEVAAFQNYPGGYWADPVDGGPEWFDIGAVSGLKFEEILEVNAEENDNVKATDRVTKQEAKIAFNMHEPFNYDVWKTMRESLDTITDTSDSFEIESGNKSELPIFIMRITTKNDGRTFWTILYYCNIAKGFNLEFPKDDAEDRRLKPAMEVNCRADDDYNSGMVYKIHVEGGV